MDPEERVGLGAGCGGGLVVGFGELPGAGGGLGGLLGDLEGVDVLVVLLVGESLQLHGVVAELGECHRCAGRGRDRLGCGECVAGGVVGGQDDRDGQVAGGGDGVGELPGLLGVHITRADQDPRQRLRCAGVVGLLVDFEEERAEVGDDGGHVGHRPDPTSGQQGRQAGAEADRHDLGVVGPPARPGLQGHRPADGENIVGCAFEE
ncbi:hypothetical protein OG323_38080 (plasmid) [Streptomyces cyaneofuscatus]|uniref:hypothetical protein n=1 Tax=Streptomyces cyaneofuscatus TaxID=66883 RepID=UPI002F907E3E|nr:hypothetical protein OG323_38080 [Streptomyces cyaneofuscatus]